MSKEQVLFNPSTLRNLADKSYEKRKTAAVEIESLVRQLATQPGSGQYINNIISTLVTDYTFSIQPNSRKGGLIALSSIAIALLHHSSSYLDLLLPPVLRCFVDQDPRVRYYACESLYNIAKICRVDILLYINELFDGLCKLAADQDADVRAACMLLDRLLKDVVSNCDAFNLAHFLPLVRERIRLQHPHVRLLIVNWISMLNSLYDVSMVEFLPDLLGGLFSMLSDPHKDIKSQTVTLLSIFLRQITKSNNIEFATMIFPIVQHSTTSERTTRIVIVNWLHNFIVLAKENLLPFLPHIIGAIFCCIHDETTETGEIKQNALHCNELLMRIVQNATIQSSNNDFPTILSHFIAQLSTPLLHARVVSLQWLSLLLTKYDSELFPFFDTLLPPLLLALQSECDMQVFVLLIECIARLALLSPINQSNQSNTLNTTTSSPPAVGVISPMIISTGKTSTNTNNGSDTIIIEKKQQSENNEEKKNDNFEKNNFNTGGQQNFQNLQQQNFSNLSTIELLELNILPPHFCLIFVNLLSLFATDVKFLELRSQRILCALSTFIPPKFIFAAICHLLKSNQDIIFTRLMVETLHLVLFTTEECAPLRQILIESAWNPHHLGSLYELLSTFFHSPVPAISLALLSQNYALASGIVSYMTASPSFHVSVGLLLQLEQFVQLFESSVFSHCRCHLLSLYTLPSHTPTVMTTNTNSSYQHGSKINGKETINTSNKTNPSSPPSSSSSSLSLSSSSSSLIPFNNSNNNINNNDDITLQQEQINALLHTLYSLLSMLPQSHCFFTLKNRLETSTVVVLPRTRGSDGGIGQNGQNIGSSIENFNQSQPILPSSSSITSPLSSIHQIVTTAIQSTQYTTPTSVSSMNRQGNNQNTVSTISLAQRMAKQVSFVQQYVHTQQLHDSFHIRHQHASFLTTQRSGNTVVGGSTGVVTEWGAGGKA